MLFLAIILTGTLAFPPLKVGAEEPDSWNDDEWSVQSIYDGDRFSENRFGSNSRDNNIINDDRPYADSDFDNGLSNGRSGNKSLGAIVSDQLKPASGR